MRRLIELLNNLLERQKVEKGNDTLRKVIYRLQNEILYALDKDQNQ